MSHPRGHGYPDVFRFTEDVFHPHPSNFPTDDSSFLAPPRPRFMTLPPRSSLSYTFPATSENPEFDHDRSFAFPMSPPHPPPSPTPANQHRLRMKRSADYVPGPVSQDIQDPLSDPGQPIFMRRPPPSSFPFPFQSHPGNPDPLPPRSWGRSSIDSRSSRPSSAQGFNDQNDPLPSPYAPFMGGPSGTYPSPTSSSSNVYKDSVAGNMAQGSQTHLPRTSSVPTFRSPFLSPASRPSSTVWSPPIQPLYGSGASNASTPQVSMVKKTKPPMPSTMLSEKLSNQEKPWLNGRKGDRSRLSWWVTVLVWFIGLGAGAVRVYFDYKSINLLDDNQLCSVFDENFDSLDLNNWTPEVQLSGFGYVYPRLPQPSRSLNCFDQQ